ncbi:hypothetical protein JVU11DRAFT_218 [Chiua virens]|nr:hypothetical protein JVU11DRAFT_218 [Chiua virens]
MSFLNVRFLVVSLAYALLASAAVSSKRSVQWLQQNGPAAKALNDQYATLTTSSPCNDGDATCVNGQYARCHQGSYLTWPCASGWSCAAIPNEWSEGTTTTCDTNDNIAWRFSEAGISESKRSTPVGRSLQWLQQNGPAAKALNDQYATLTTSSPCNDGDATCVNGQYARCHQGSYLTWPCASGWSCAAIPNEWSEGTTTTCDTNDNIAWKFSEAGISES